MGYRLISSKEGIMYLEKNNRTLQDFSREYHIPSRNGSIYELPSGEIVLILLIGKDEYPGFIFDNYESFKKCCDADFFPIEEKDMTWLELHARQMKDFLTDGRFYMQPLEKVLKIEVPFKNVKDCEKGYEKLETFIGGKKNTNSDKVEGTYCYALAIAKFLIEEKGYTWKLMKRHEIYNPYYYPLLSQGGHNNVYPMSSLHIAVGKTKRMPFRDFYWYLTGIPTQVKVD